MDVDADTDVIVTSAAPLLFNKDPADVLLLTESSVWSAAPVPDGLETEPVAEMPVLIVIPPVNSKSRVPKEIFADAPVTKI